MKTMRPDQHRYLKLLPYSDVLLEIERSFSQTNIGVETVSVEISHGRICAENIRSTCDIPARTHSAMDGYAIKAEETSNAGSRNPVSFLVKGSIYPEDAEKTNVAIKGDETYRVTTGAPVPEGADAVVKVEDTRFDGKYIFVHRPVERWKNISLKAEDVSRGEITVRKHSILTPANISLLMSTGVMDVRVFKIPKVGILSIGNELIGLDHLPSAGHLVNNYLYLVMGFLKQLGIEAENLGLSKDDPREITRVIEKAIDHLDVVFTIGGSSVGTKDFTPDALLALDKSSEVFHGVRVVPIRPAGLVLAGNKPIVILPGHAVSAALTFFLIGLPIINLLSGLRSNDRRALIMAEAQEALGNDRPIDALELVQVQTDSEGRFYALPLGWGSNLENNLSKANGFVKLRRKEEIQKGSMISVQLFGAYELSGLPIKGNAR